MSKSIGSRISDAFSAEERDRLATYLGWLQDTMSEVARTVRRNVTLLFTSAALFELLLRSKGTVLSLGPVRVTTTATIVPFLPTLSGYLYLETILGSTRFNRSVHAFSEAVRVWNPKAWDNDIDILVVPPMPTYWKVANFTRAEFSTTGDKIEIVVASLFLVLGTLGTIAFEGYAFWSLHGTPHINMAVFWTNAVLTTMLIGTGTTHLVVSPD